jgi:hypothetical protein
MRKTNSSFDPGIIHYSSVTTMKNKSFFSFLMRETEVKGHSTRKKFDFFGGKGVNYNIVCLNISTKLHIIINPTFLNVIMYYEMVLS